MIKPSHYDDDGYVIQWFRSYIPSNTLAALNGLAEDCRSRNILGPDVELVLSTYDETNSRIDTDRILRGLPEDPNASLIALVGVQTNQFPRAVDIARRFRAKGRQVALGGFHVSGTISMLDDIQPDVQEALDLGIAIFAGEAEENRFDTVIRDAANGSLQPIYNYMPDLPNIATEPIPLLPAEHLRRTAAKMSSFDLGRGCPFQCSFCTIINVQGRKSRFRSADDLELIIRKNLAQGINRFFITDDNLARNRMWESFFDRLIELREQEGLNIKFTIQVDTLCHRIENFIEKAGRAGVARVFIGLENINPDNLMAVKKKQNRIVEYREMLQAWRSVGSTTYAGYILGFPGDTYDSIMRDIDIIKRELPLDLLEFFYLTPLPGSEDHKKMHESSVWMDPDMNKYDLNHRVSHHPTMTDAEWERAYNDAWNRYYSPDHVKTVMRRMAASGTSPGKIMTYMILFSGWVKIEGVHPLEAGFLRRKTRRDRRPGLPTVPAWRFYPAYVAETVAKQIKWLSMFMAVLPEYRRLKRNPDRTYSDLAVEPIGRNKLASLDLIGRTMGGTGALEKMRLDTARLKKARAARSDAAQ